MGLRLRLGLELQLGGSSFLAGFAWVYAGCERNAQRKGAVVNAARTTAKNQRCLTCCFADLIGKGRMPSFTIAKNPREMAGDARIRCPSRYSSAARRSPIR